MFQFTSRFLPSRPQLSLTEDEIRRLCGGAFERADFLQRAGSVSTPVARGHQLRASVRGIWRRMHQVEIIINGNRLQPSCDRDGATFCPHVGAVLLHWLRVNASFSAYSTVPEVDDDWARDEFGDDDWDEWEALGGERPAVSAAPGPLDLTEPDTSDLVDELMSTLSMTTIANLRAIARRRGIRVSGNKKADILTQLAAGLIDPENIDAALATLSADDRLILDTIDLMTITRPAPTRAIPDAARMLGLSISVNVEDRLQTLADQVLVELIPNSPFVPGGYVIPTSVSARLGVISGLLPELQGNAEDGHVRSARLDLMELLLVLVHDIERQLLESGPGSVFTDQTTDHPMANSYIPPGFRIHPDEHIDMAELFPRLARGEKPTIRLVPAPPLLQRELLERIADRTGQPVAAVAFASQLMLALQIPLSDDMMSDREDRLRHILGLPPGTRSQMFVGAWYTLLGMAETWLLFSEHGRLRLSWKPRYGAPRHGLLESLIEGIRLIARIVGRLPAGVTFDIADLTQLVIRLIPSSAPSLARLHQTRDETDLVVAIVESGDAGERPLTLSSRDDWATFIREIVDVVVSEPLRWQGYVDIGPDRPDERVQWFRARPLAGVLSGRAVATLPEVPPPPIQIHDDMTVFVPPGTTDPTIHALLARAGELIEGSATGLRYRLMPDGVREFFDAGVSGKQFVDGLALRAGVAVPAAVRTTLERWWEGFGAVRLYDELTLIELSDDVLVHELRVATSLSSALLHTFSPRLIAVDPDVVDRVISELTTRGYAPRVIEES